MFAECHAFAKIIRGKDGLKIALMIIAFVLTFFLKVNVVFIILGAAAVGALRLLTDRKGDAA